LRLSADPKRWISVTAPVAPVARVSRAFLRTCAEIVFRTNYRSLYGQRYGNLNRDLRAPATA